MITSNAFQDFSLHSCEKGVNLKKTDQKLMF